MTPEEEADIELTPDQEANLIMHEIENNWAGVGLKTAQQKSREIIATAIHNSRIEYEERGRQQCLYEIERVRQVDGAAEVPQEREGNK